jgi:hypothetical protein
MKMAAYRRIVVETPLDGDRDRGAREPNRTITPTFILPLKGKDSDAVAGRFLQNLATSAAPPQFERISFH